MTGAERAVAKQRSWLLYGKDLLLGRQSSLWCDRLLLAQRQFGSVGCSGHIIMDLFFLINLASLLRWSLGYVPASSRSGESK